MNYVIMLLYSDGMQNNYFDKKLIYGIFVACDLSVLTQKNI